MIGPHDMGGLSKFGLINHEIDEPIFHAEWEKSALAIVVAMGFCGFWNIDTSRHARERIGWGNYLNYSYYKIWISALEILLRENGLAETEEILSGDTNGPGRAPVNIIGAEQVEKILRSGGQLTG